MASRSGPRVTAPHNLVLCLDAGNIKSYDPIKSPTTVNSLVGNITSSSYNSNINHSTSDGGYWSFDKDDTGDGFEFDSVTSFMPLGSSDMTYEIWAKFNSNLSKPLALIKTLANGSESFNFLIYDISDRLLVYKDGDYINGQIVASSNSTTNYVWRHFIITHDTSTGTVKVYINGSLDTTNTDTTNWGAYSNNSDDQYLVRIGAGEAPNDGFTIMEGDISIVRFYKGKVLTASEVTKNYETFKHRFGI